LHGLDSEIGLIAPPEPAAHERRVNDHMVA
jgi:hypothetical protein